MCLYYNVYDFISSHDANGVYIGASQTRTIEETKKNVSKLKQFVSIAR